MKTVHHLISPVPLPNGRPLHAVALRPMREDDEPVFRAFLDCAENDVQARLQSLTERLSGLPRGVIRLAESEDLCAIYEMVGDHCRRHFRTQGRA